MPDFISYANKTTVVTGAATGVGAALVRTLRAVGAARIVALDIKPCQGPVDQAIQVDLSDPHALDEAVTALPSTIDILFNNAGVAATLPNDIVMAVNVLAPRKLIAALQDRIPKGGAVVNTASSAGIGYPDRIADIQTLLAIDDWDEALDWVHAHPDLTQNAYTFSKECAQVLTLQLAKTLGRKDIRINSVCPGIIDTPLLPDFNASMGKPIIDWMVSQSGHRRATPDEVANALTFLGSDAATYMNGTNMLIDNGFTAAVITNQIDYSAMPAVDDLMNASRS